MGVPQSLEQERTLSPLGASWSDRQDRLVPVITMKLGSSNQLVFPGNHWATSGDSCDNAHSHRNRRPSIQRKESVRQRRLKVESDWWLHLSVRSWSVDCDTPYGAAGT